MLGEVIYMKIAPSQPELAGKITGMLLEMDNDELVFLIDNDAALREKVDEALKVYDEWRKNEEGGAGPDGEGAAPAAEAQEA